MTTYFEHKVFRKKVNEMKVHKTSSVDELQKFEANLKKYNWVIMVIAVITIPFIVSNL